MPSRNPNRPAPARRSPAEPPKPDRVEPRQGFYFVLDEFTDRSGKRQVVTKKIVRVVRQGTHEHGQGAVWTIEYEVECMDEDGRVVTEKLPMWVMYDEVRQQWADALLVQRDAAARGTPIHAAPSKIPPLGPVGHISHRRPTHLEDAVPSGETDYTNPRESPRDAND